ncbi:hypothetical protein, partial [Streptococcus parasuis]|uniref:hypothetical protein n=1 Tax=Streptococcus parasuis TaxID=1501662 RepID=UPI001A90D31A
LTASSLLSNEITGLLKDSETNIFKQGEVANFIIELSKFTTVKFSSQNQLLSLSFCLKYDKIKFKRGFVQKRVGRIFVSCLL